MPVCESSSTLDTKPSNYRLLQWTVVVVMALACALSLSLNMVEPDLWGHVRYAQDWLAEGELPRTASHTYTAIGHPWVNHENLAELCFATGYAWFGANGLLIAKCIWGMAIVLSMAWIARRHDVHPMIVWPLMVLIAANLEAFFPVRPQLLSFGLCAVALVILDRAFSLWSTEQKIRWSFLLVLPPLFVVWVNSHGGFVAGLCIVGAFLAGRIVECVVRRHDSAWRDAMLLSLIGGGCVAATLVNPYGLGLHQWIIDSLSRPRPEINEWTAPALHEPIFWPWIGLMGVASASLAATRRRRDWAQVAILILVAWQSAMHLRHIAFLALLVGFWVPPHLQSALARLRPKQASQLPPLRLSRWTQSFLVGGLMVAIGVQGTRLSQRLTDYSVNRNAYAVDALQFMADHQLHGRLVVSFNWAQYAIAALAPKTQVAFDGRFRTCYPQEMVDMHFDFLLGEFGGERSRSEKSGPIDGTKILEHGDPDLVLIDRRYENAVAVMKAEAMRDNPEWTLLYCDRVAELWGRSDRYDNPTHADYFPMSARLFDASSRDGSVPWPALPKKQTTSQLAKQQDATTPGSKERETRLRRPFAPSQR